MDRPKHTHESRCLSILIGDVLRWGVESRARAIATERNSNEIAPKDMIKAAREFFEADLDDLPRRVDEALQEHYRDICRAA